MLAQANHIFFSAAYAYRLFKALICASASSMSGIAKSNSFPDLFFLHQIAALIVGIAVVIDAGELLLIAAHMLAHHLVEVVVLVGILFALGGTALLQQVAQRIIGKGPCGS